MLLLISIIISIRHLPNPDKKITFDIDYKIIESAFQKKEHWIKDLAALKIILNYDWKNFNQAELDRVDNMFRNKVDLEKIVKKKNINEYNHLLKLYSNTLENYAGYVEQLPGNPGNKTPIFKKKGLFPIENKYPYSFNNDFGSERTFGGKRSHQGIDIMTNRNTPAIAIEDCRIAIIGWDELGGNRINMVSLDGNRRYYYAHFEKYPPDLKKGSSVAKGSIVGYIGSSGYGPPGSDTGTDPHLHIQIWIKSSNFLGNKEELINPYNILKFLENNRS